MHSIRKIVLTPVKWASKKILRRVLSRTLLRFPGNDPHDPLVCVYCPELCRFSCPTAVVSGNDAVTPRNKNALLHKAKQWPEEMKKRAPYWTVYDCTGCGRCTEYCVYGMPVADHLFEARQAEGQTDFAWPKAQALAQELSDEMDPYGDLADELGDKKNAERRLKNASQQRPIIVDEPRVLFYLNKNGVSAQLSWDSWLSDFRAADFASMAKNLQGQRWLFLESVWLSRRLNRDAEVNRLYEQLSSHGVLLKRPFAHGRDAIDNGGETVYRKLFPDQARQMAIDLWERDRKDVDGLLCLSERAASHYREIYQNQFPIISISQIYGEKNHV